MDKRRLEKRHKRQVARERARVHLSEPDLRTPEQIKAAREASRPEGSQRTEWNAGRPTRGRESAGGTADPTTKAEG